MKNLLKFFGKKHLFIPYRWSTKPTSYGQDEELTTIDDFVCAKCGQIKQHPWEFTETDCR
jgi:hypothetical protein